MKKCGFFVIISALFCFSCVGLMEKTGRFLDGSAFAEKTKNVYRAEIGVGSEKSVLEVLIVENKDKEQSLVITLSSFPMIKLRGTMPNQNNDFLLTSLDYLSGSTHGWNEYSMQTLGNGNLILGENATLEYINEIEQIQISNGRIHRYDTRITGDNALTALRNRHERVSALAEWMQTLENPQFKTIKDFENHWKPVLFPEIVSRNKRPAAWRADGDVFTRADDINWNSGYTERTLPEELWPLRNTGTLLRDWEEALSQIYFEYEWEKIIGIFSKQIILTKVR